MSVNKKPYLPKSGLKFSFFPGYARYLLTNRLREFTREHWKLTKEINFPVLHFYNAEQPGNEEDIERSIMINREFLISAAENKLSEQLKESISTWLSDQLPLISRDQVTVEDITGGSYIRKQAFLHYIPEYTSNVNDALQLISEIDRLILETESLSFHAFFKIQEEKINRINQELTKREEQLLEAQEISSLGSFEWRLDGSPSVYTAELHKIFETDPDKKQELSAFLEYVFPGDRMRVKEAIEKAINETGRYECEYRYKKNKEEKILWSRGVVNYEDGKAVSMIGTVMDITDRHYMLQRLQLNEELYKQAQKLTHIGNWAWNMHNGRMTLSDELFSILGLTPESGEISAVQFFSYVHPDDQEIVEQQWSEAINNPDAPSIDFRIIRPDGSIRVIHQNIEMLKDEAGNPYKIVGTGQDRTQEYVLNKEITQKNKELERSNKELTSFSYVVSHDLQEPLRKIKTFTDIILGKEAEKLSEEGRQHFSRIVSSANRMQKLIDDLLSFSRTQNKASIRESTDLNTILEDSIKSVKENMPDTALNIKSEKLPVINAISFQIRQLFDNIIGNSVKYARTNVTPELRISASLIREKELFPDAVHDLNSYHRIRFSDNGIGFDQAYAEKIFEVFQRLHGRNEYSGTGIGLSICKKIAENHSGFMLAHGRINEGAVFEVYFPVNL
jgi:signal transduction histidine kinase